MNYNTKIYWVRSWSPEGKERVPFYFKRRLSIRTNEGERGDVQLGNTLEDSHVVTVDPESCELEDGSPAFRKQSY